MTLRLRFSKGDANCTRRARYAVTVADMFTYVTVYFITTSVILFNLDSLLLIPFVVWFVLVALAIWFLFLGSNAQPS